MFAALEENEDEDEDEAASSSSTTVSQKERGERRREEVEALLAIYGESCWEDGETIFLRVSPRQWSASAAAPTVELEARRDEGYPDKRALGPIEIRGARVPGKKLAALRAELRARARELVGEVAVHELAILACEALEALETAALSLNERMLERERQERELDARRDAREERERAVRADEGARLAAAALESEARRHGPLEVGGAASEESSDDDLERTTSKNKKKSRYASDFRELGILGRGAFGEVAKCKNRLDRRIYAIKKVRLDEGASRREARRQLREVEALATVENPRLVRYFQAWVEDDDNRASSSDDETDSSSSERSSSSSSLVFTLYIQMEFCPRTLRELIDSRALVGRPDDAWRLVRQIIEALAYLHFSCGIVHRDLKPANVFVDASANVKVGDLGLATVASRVEPAAPEEDELVGGSGSITRGVGTALYRAPEVMAATTYDRAADMYSLGVIVYEIMHAPFETGMERIERLEALRRGRPTFDEVVDRNARALASRLVAENPSARPTAVGLLEGRETDLLPASADTIDGDAALLSRAKATIRNPHSRSRATLVRAIFDAETTQLSEYYSYCRPGKPTTTNHRRLRSLSVDEGGLLLEAVPRLRAVADVERRLRDIFERHGAVPLAAPVLRPRPPRRAEGETTTTNTTTPGFYELVDPRGTVVVLPSELTTAFARRVAAEPIRQEGVFRRYEIGRVFDRGEKGPRERPAAAFDVACLGPRATRTLEAECLALAASLAPPLKGVVHAGHADLAALATLRLDADFEARCARAAARDDPLEALDALATALSKIRRGDDDDARERAVRKVRAAIRDLSALLGAARDSAGLRWQGPKAAADRRAVVVDLASRPGLEPFGEVGPFFYVLSDEEDHYLCAGGRYDATVARHVVPKDRPDVQTRAVGLRVDTDTLRSCGWSGGGGGGVIHLDPPTPPRGGGGVEGPALVYSPDRTDSGDCSALRVAAMLRGQGLRAFHLPLAPATTYGVGRKKKSGDDAAICAAARGAAWVVALDAADRATVVNASAGYLPTSPRREVSISSLASALGGGGKPLDSPRSFRVVRCVDSRQHRKSKNIDRNVAAALELVLGSPVELDDRGTRTCVAVDAPLVSARRVATAFLESDLRAAREAAARERNRFLRIFADELADAFFLGGNNHRLVVYVYSVHDDAIDLVALPRKLAHSDAHASSPDGVSTYTQ
ncbi:hypothetical protein CTAYLR_002239 [Chrysophaeum taylorii]|uniref:non-specific serine/threonine protein kinase n=1 Tax=Chrysophaeum taylorii TaxID=2483200 RepID=A0AAD7UPK8_9STRA|nr:hypothetical protein CTAYLR_002239 [Chrysophaeum taylorii]